MARIPGLNQWVNRTTREFVQQTSSGEMERRFPAEVFHDAEGEPTSNANWIHAPDLSAVVGQPTKYWIIAGDSVRLMSQVARDAVDAGEVRDRRDSQIATVLDDPESDLRQVVKLIVGEINLLRQQHGLPDRTLVQVRNQLRNGLGS